MSIYPFLKIPSNSKKPKTTIISTWDIGLVANDAAIKSFANGGTPIDAVESAAISIENTINCCVGLGGNPDRDGHVTLDACIMDHKYNCGSVAFLEQIKNPISVARKVMETSPHVMLVGSGAYQFALQNGFEAQSQELSGEAKDAYTKWLEKSEYKPIINIENVQKNDSHPAPPAKLPGGKTNHDTIGILALNSQANLAGACTTSGMAFKMRGRIGDSPIIGSGLYVAGDVGAATGSGQGEEVIRVSGCHLIVEYMRQGHSPKEACKKAIKRIININPEKSKSFQVGFIALDKHGKYGAYAIHPGFTYTVTIDGEVNQVFNSDSYY